MAQVIRIERKSAVLTPSSLACLAHVPTVNLTAGCAHECRYCYARGYLTHPGEGKITFYTNTLAKLREELRRKRKKPTTVYFSPSSDPFQPVPEVLNMAYDVFRFLLESEIGVAFVTKGRIPERHRNLLAAHAPLVQGRIGLITLDPGTAAAFEPGAATPEVRLAQAAELIGARVPVEARLDPILARRDRRRGLPGTALCGIGAHRRAQDCRQRPLSPASGDRIAAAARGGQGDAQQAVGPLRQQRASGDPCGQQPGASASDCGAS